MSFKKFGSLTFILSLVLSSLAIVPAFAESIYHQPQVDTAEFEKLSTNEQDELLLKSFYKRKGNVIFRKALRESAYYCPGFTIVGVAAPVVFLMNPDPHLLVLYGGFALGVGNACYEALQMIFSSGEDDPLLKYEIQFVRERRFLPTPRITLIERQLNLGRVDPKQLPEVGRLVQTALNLPRKIVRSEFNPKRLDELFVGYQPHLRDQIESFIFEQVLMENNFKPKSSNKNEENYREGKRIVGFLYGPPGAGKTRYAELISQALTVPFAQISLAGTSIDDLVGDATKPGLIIEALSQAKHQGSSAKNAVLFMDEADRIINGDSKNSKSLLPFLLKLLDPEFKFFYSPYLKQNVDLSHLAIILAGNFMIEDEALRRRLFLIDFPGFSPEYKKQIVMNTTLQKFIESHSKNKRYLLSREDVSEDDIRRIERLIEMDHDPGMRTIELVLAHYLSFVSKKKHVDSTMAEPPFIEEMIHDSNQDILNYRNKFSDLVTE